MLPIIILKCVASKEALVVCKAASDRNILLILLNLLLNPKPLILEELVVPYQPTRSLQSESRAFLAVPTKRGVTYGNRCFRKAAATIWNNLLVTIRKCKTIDTLKKVYYVFTWKELCIFKDVNLLHP